jgi:hypothetical protein
VRTALLLSKHVSPFDIRVDTIQGEVTLEGQVPSEQLKTVAGAIAQDTASVKQVHNNLSVNPSTERNPDREHLGERVADLEIRLSSPMLFRKIPIWLKNTSPRQ